MENRGRIDQKRGILELVIFRKIYLLISKNRSFFGYIFIEKHTCHD